MTFLSDTAIEHLRAIAVWPEFTNDRYCVLEEIGRGGMGVVYAARDTALLRDVAIKVVNAIRPEGDLQTNGDHRLAGGLEHEARVLARLEHPGIVPVHDCGMLADGRPFYVMKRVHGRNLHTYLKSSIPPLADRLRIFERISEAVAFAHAQGVIHRDLKPSNVMVGDFGEVMVMDWGVAAVRRDVGDRQARAVDDRVVLGTHGFMAPEQAVASGDVDERADVYSLGAVLFVLLTGKAPPGAGNAGRALAAAKEVAGPLRSICIRSLAAGAGERYSSVVEMAEDVRRFRDGERVTAHRESAAERTARVVKKYQVPIILVLAYIVMRALIAVFAGA